MDRKKLIIELKKFKKRIEKKYSISKIVLFGSRADNNKEIRKNTDVDLIVVGNFKEKNNLKRSPALYLEWHLDLPIDVICYTPEEFEKLSKTISIVRDALKKGIIIS